MRLFPALMTILLLVTSFWVVAEDVPEPPRQMLIEKMLDLPEIKAKVSLTKVIFPKGYKTLPHAHEGSGPRYVVKGRVKIEEEGQVQEYGPGQVFWESGQTMTAENISDGEAEIIIFEVTPKKKSP